MGSNGCPCKAQFCTHMRKKGGGLADTPRTPKPPRKGSK